MGRGETGYRYEVYGEATALGEAASGGGVPREVPLAVGDRSDEREIEAGDENRSPASEAVGAGAPCGDVESVGFGTSSRRFGRKKPGF